jgi:hypothetical protein
MMSATFERPSEAGNQGQSASDTVDRTFSTGDTCRLSLDNPRGSVRVTAWDRPEVHLVATKRLDASRGRFLATRVETRQDGDAITIQTILDPSDSYADRVGLSGVAAEVVRAFTDLLGANGSPTEVDYDVHVPKQSTIDLKGVSSKLEVAGTSGPLRVRVVSGSIDTQSVTGSLDLGTVSGEIDVRGVDGQIRSESVSGSLRVDGRLASLRAKTVSGEIEVTGSLAPDGSIELASVSGSASLQIPALTKATITLRGLSGDVQCDLPVTVDRNHRGPGIREWSGRLNGGGSPIALRTVSGSLRLTALPVATGFESTPASSADSATTESASVVAEPAEGTNQVDSTSDGSEPATANEPTEMQILQALERGEVNVDEALRRIDALRAQTS